MRGRSSHLILSFLLTTILLAGCLAGPPSSEDTGPSSVDHRPSDNLRGSRGGIQGNVSTPNGSPVPRAKVAIRNETGATDANGTFLIRDLRPGTAMINVRHPRYQPVTRSVEILEGSIAVIEIEMTEANFTSLWEGQRVRKLVDRTVPWHDNGTAQNVYETAIQPLFAECYNEDEGRVDPYKNHRIRLDNRSDLVFPGTRRIRLTLDWSSQDYRGDALVLAYKPPGRSTFTESPYIAKGEPFTVNVTPWMWDGPKQDQTEWTFWLCTARDDDWIPTDDGYQPWPFVGEIRIRMELIRETNSGAQEAPK